MRQITLMGFLGLMLLGLTITPLQADFIQCPPCDGTANADVVNGSPLAEIIDAGMGNDIVFGGDGDDQILGNEGNDFISGGLGSDDVFGDPGNDILLAGPDAAPDFFQIANGGAGNDTTNVLVSETTGCLIIDDISGIDVVNLVGFGPYSASVPFGQPGFIGMYVHVVDPISGGDILILVSEANDAGIETINGLLNPNVTIGPLPQGCELP